MKKSKIFLIFLALAAMSLMACVKEDGQLPTPYELVNNTLDLTMKVKEGSLSSEGLTLIFENTTDVEAIYSEFFALEKKTDKEWCLCLSELTLPSSVSLSI